MDDAQKSKYEFEAARGEQYQRIWDLYVKPFYEAKTYDLFAAFQEVSISDAAAMVVIKQQSAALESLMNEFKHYMDTGKLAQKTLTEEKENESIS